MLNPKQLYKLSLYTLLSRFLGQIRATLWGSILATSLWADSFYLAIKLPNMLRAYFAEGAMNAAFVPTYTKLLSRDKKDRKTFLLSIAVIFFVLIGLLTTLVNAFALEVVEFYLLFADEQLWLQQDTLWLKKTAFLLQIAFFYLAFISFTTLFASVLQGHQITSPMGFSPVIYNLVNILGGCIIFFGGVKVEGYEATKWLTYFLVAAGGVQLFHMFLVFFLNRKKLFSSNEKEEMGEKDELAENTSLLDKERSNPLKKTNLSPTKKTNLSLEREGGDKSKGEVKRKRLNEDVRTFFSKLSPVAFASLAHHLNIFFMDPIAMSLGSGVVATLFYSNRLLELPLGLLAFPLGAVGLPRLSIVAQDTKNTNSQNTFEKTVRYMLEMLLLFLVPIMIVAMYYRLEISSIVFKFGKMTGVEIQNIADVFFAHALALPALGITRVMTTAYYAKGNVKDPLYAAIVSLFVSIPLAFCLTFFFKSAPMIALASSTASYCMMIYLFLKMPSQLSMKVGVPICMCLLRYLLAGLIGFVFSYLLTELFAITLENFIYFVGGFWLEKILLLIEIIFFSGLFFIFYFLVLKIIQDPSLEKLIKNLPGGEDATKN